MTINNTTRRIQYTANGSQTAFTVPFEFFVNADLQVYKNSTLQNSGYTVTGAGVDAGGTVTFGSAPANGTVITIAGYTARQRTTDYQNQGSFRNDLVNSDFDHIWAVLKEQEDNLLKRTIQLQVFDTSTAVILPIASDRANKALIFASDGTVTVSADNYSDQLANVTAQAVAAAASAASAATSATTSSTQASNSSTSATAAATSATAAATSATAAATSATTATTQASNASTSATTATTQASNASTSATAAATSATAAATSATAAATSATTATTQASNASTSATAAATSATNASTSATNASNSYNNFRGIFYGSASSDPTLDPNGNAITTGDLYFNSVANALKVYSGSAWQLGVTDVSTLVAKSGDTMTGNLLINVAQSSGTLLTVQNISSNSSALSGFSFITDAGSLQLRVRSTNGGGLAQLYSNLTGAVYFDQDVGSPGGWIFRTSNSFNTSFEVTHTASSVNNLRITGGATGVGPVLSAQGETNVDVNITPKGTGKVIHNGMTRFTVTTGISAAGTTQGGATALTADENEVTTCASGAGVVLPAFGAGMRIVVHNRGANALLVYPPSGAAINALSTNAGFTLGVNASIMFSVMSSTKAYALTAVYA